MKVFCLGEEFWIGSSLEECIKAAREEYGDDALLDDECDELDDSQLQAMQITVTDEDERPTGEVRTFAQQRDIEITEGGQFPRVFAFDL